MYFDRSRGLDLDAGAPKVQDTINVRPIALWRLPGPLKLDNDRSREPRHRSVLRNNQKSATQSINIGPSIEDSSDCHHVLCSRSRRCHPPFSPHRRRKSCRGEERCFGPVPDVFGTCVRPESDVNHNLTFTDIQTRPWFVVGETWWNNSGGFSSH